MKHFHYFIIVMAVTLLVPVTSCKHQKTAAGNSSVSETVRYSGGQGTSFEDAVIIMEKTETTGVDAEYDWLREHYPGYKLVSQSLSSKDGKHYDVMKIKTASGEDKTVYFDISNFFGKW